MAAERFKACFVLICEYIFGLGAVLTHYFVQISIGWGRMYFCGNVFKGHFPLSFWCSQQCFPAIALISRGVKYLENWWGMKGSSERLVFKLSFFLSLSNTTIVPT